MYGMDKEIKNYAIQAFESILFCQGNIWAIPSENVSLNCIYRTKAQFSDYIFMQSHQKLYCTSIESLDTVEYIDIYKRP